MKKFFLLTLAVITIGLCVTVAVLNTEEQNLSINFEQNKEWKELIRKAKKENKLIFVCCISRGGKNSEFNRAVFFQEEVAEFFNKNFISVEYKSTDADAVLVKKRFAVDAFPIFLFVDPAIDKVVNRLLGYPKADRLIARAKKAIDTQKKLSGMVKRYKLGERGYEFIVDYLSVLRDAYMYEEEDIVAIEYLNSLPSEQFATKDNWEFIIKSIFDPLSAPLRKVMANRDIFYELVGKEEVDMMLRVRIGLVVNGLVDMKVAKPSRRRMNFNEQLNTDVINYLLSVDSWEYVPAELAKLYTADYIRKSDFRGLLNKMREVLGQNLLGEISEKVYFRYNIKVFAYCKEKELVKEAIKWIDQRCERSSDYLNKANLMESKSYIQYLTGDKEGAEKTQVEEKKYEKEYEKSSGSSRIMSAPRLK